MAARKKKARRKAKAPIKGAAALAKAQKKAAAARRRKAAVLAVTGDAGWLRAIDDMVASITFDQARRGRLDPRCPIGQTFVSPAIMHPKVLEGALEVFLDSTCGGPSAECRCKHYALAASIAEQTERATGRDFDDLFEEVTLSIDRFLDLRESGKGAN